MRTFTATDLTNPDHPAVVAALRLKCPVCPAKPGAGCTNPAPPYGPLRYRVIHEARIPEEML